MYFSPSHMEQSLLSMNQCVPELHWVFHSPVIRRFRASIWSARCGSTSQRSQQALRGRASVTPSGPMCTSLKPSFALFVPVCKSVLNFPSKKSMISGIVWREEYLDNLCSERDGRSPSFLVSVWLFLPPTFSALHLLPSLISLLPLSQEGASATRSLMWEVAPGRVWEDCSGAHHRSHDISRDQEGETTYKNTRAWRLAL